MKRKLVKQGVNALTISLPAKWVKKYDLKAGEEVDITEERGKITINQSKERPEKEIKIKIPEDAVFSRRYLFLPYMRGYNSIKVICKNPETMRQVELHAPFLLGFEIVDQGSDYMLIKNIAKGIEEEFDTMFNRQMMVAITMGKDIHDAAKNNDFVAIERVKGMENLANKLNIFCRRMLNVHGYKEEKKTNGMYHLTGLIEDICDIYKDICNEILSKKLKLSKDSLKLMESVNEYFDMLYKLMHKMQDYDLTKVRTIEKDIKNKVKKNLVINPKDVVVVSLLRTIVNDIHHGAEELLD